MADDQPERPAPDGPGGTPGPDNGPGQPADPDATRVTGVPDADATRISPAPDRAAGQLPLGADPDATQVVAGADPDATRVVPGSDPDATRVVDSGDATRIVPPGQPARVRPGAPDPTAIMPPAIRGRAEVPKPPADDDAFAGWEPVEPERRSFLVPVLIGLVIVIVLGALAFGLVTAFRHANKPVPNPTAVAPVTPPASASATTPPASSPATAAPSGSVPASEGGVVVVPENLVGLDLTLAEQQLAAVGLTNIQEIAQVSVTAVPETVLQVSPVGGTNVVPGSKIILTYAILPTSPSPSAATSAASPSPSPSD